MQRWIVLSLLLLTATIASADNYEQCVERSIRNRAYADGIACLRTAEASESKSYRIAYLFGDVFLRASQPDSAIAHLKRAIELRDEYHEALELLGDAYTASKNYPGAIDAYQRAVKAEHRDVTYRTTLGLGHAYAMADSFKLASLWISKAIEIDPKQTDAIVELGDLYERNHVYILAKEQYRQALAAQPNSLALRGKLARAFMKSAEYDSAVAEYNAILAIDSNDRGALTELADIYTSSKRWAGAHTMFHRLSTLEPGNIDYKFHEGVAAYKAHLYAEAIAPLDAVSAGNVPDSVRIVALRFLAESYTAEKRRPEAAAVYEKLLRADSTSMGADDYRRYAGALLEMKDTVKAFNALEVYTLKDTSDCDICKLLGPRKMLQKDYAGAIRFFVLRLKRCDTTLSTLKNIGLCYQVLEKQDSAELWYKAVLAKKPYDGWTTSQLANLYFQKEERDSVLALYKDFLAHVNPDSTPANELGAAYKYVGVVYLIKKDFAPAVENLKKALTISKDDCDVLLWLAQSYHNLQQKDDACKYYKEVVARGCKNAKSARDGLKLLECQ